MQNKTIVAFVGSILLASIVLIVTNGSNNSSVAKNAGVYCSSDGTLTNTKTIQSHRSYCVKSDSGGKTYSANTPSEYSFFIIDDQGNTLKDFAITHTKMMHVIVIRQDLNYFQHVHPDFNKETGVFTLKDLTFPVDGMYRIFADFAPAGAQMDAMGMPLTATPFQDVAVGSGANYQPAPLENEDRIKTFDANQVAFSSGQPLISGKEIMLTFSLSHNGRPITDLQEYLGALGHSVILSAGKLDFIHAHPIEDVSAKQNGKVDFMVTFPDVGTYKIFTQFRRKGKVFTTDFVVVVAQGTSVNPMEGPNMHMEEGAGHSMMQMTQ